MKQKFELEFTCAGFFLFQTNRIMLSVVEKGRFGTVVGEVVHIILSLCATTSKIFVPSRRFKLGRVDATS